MPDSFFVLDTHTGGEITRVLLGADLGLSDAPAETLLQQLRGPLDWVRRSLTSEPRGSEFAVGAVVMPPTAGGQPGSIVFFNNVGYLGMCGHGLIGVVEALRHRSLLSAGTYWFETPAGRVAATLQSDRQVRFTGVPSRCYRRDVSVTCDDGCVVVGDIAYGGNWFFLAPDDAVANESMAQLMYRTQQIRDALERDQVRGADQALIDHVELYCSLHRAETAPAVGTGTADGRPGCRNFVLCPGGHYDRSPCGTGTSAKLACMAASGQLQPGQEWIQESVTGSRFVASYENDGQSQVRVTITGRAHVIAETIQVYDDADPLRMGIGGTAR